MEKVVALDDADLHVRNTLYARKHVISDGQRFLMEKNGCSI